MGSDLMIPLPLAQSRACISPLVVVGWDSSFALEGLWKWPEKSRVRNRECKTQEEECCYWSWLGPWHGHMHGSEWKETKPFNNVGRSCQEEDDDVRNTRAICSNTVNNPKRNAQHKTGSRNGIIDESGIICYIAKSAAQETLFSALAMPTFKLREGFLYSCDCMSSPIVHASWRLP